MRLIIIGPAASPTLQRHTHLTSSVARTPLMGRCLPPDELACWREALSGSRTSPVPYDDDDDDDNDNDNDNDGRHHYHYHCHTSSSRRRQCRRRSRVSSTGACCAVHCIPPIVSGEGSARGQGGRPAAGWWGDLLRCPGPRGTVQGLKG